MDILKKGKSEIDKSERDSERVEDGRASTKASNGDGEPETGEEEDAAPEARTDGEHRIGQDELDQEGRKARKVTTKTRKMGRRNPRDFSTVLGRVVIYSFSCTLFFRIKG